MNRYVKEAMESSSSLPQTFEAYQLLRPVDKQRITMAHISKLRNEYDSRVKSRTTLKPIVFNR